MGQYDRQAQSQRKHGPIISSSATRAGAAPPIHRPEWRGSGYVKKRVTRQQPTGPSKPVPTIQDQKLPFELQQSLLNIFRSTFLQNRDFSDLKIQLGELNEALLNRDWEAAFGDEEKREVFALRWGPSRALAYANVLAWICEVRSSDEFVRKLCSDQSQRNTARIVCFGGGAAEIMAFAGLARFLRAEAAGKPIQQKQSPGEPDPAETPIVSDSSAPLLDLRILDTTDWTSIITTLQTNLTTPPTLSKYASAAARASNTSFLSPHTLKPSFHQTPILNLNTEELQNILGTEAILVTFFLSLTNLFTTSIPKTTSFLRNLAISIPKDSLLLVIDNIDATIEIPSKDDGKESKTTQSYPMSWLLDRVLLGKPQKEDGEEKIEVKRWEKVVSEDMKVHKLDEKLRYPGSLENFRFQMHLFRRL